MQQIRASVGSAGINQVVQGFGGDLIESTVMGREGFIKAKANELQVMESKTTDKEVVEELRKMREALLAELKQGNQNTARAKSGEGNSE
jgi:rRNA maturation endonuclease Nob1